MLKYLLPPIAVLLSNVSLHILAQNDLEARLFVNDIDWSTDSQWVSIGTGVGADGSYSIVCDGEHPGAHLYHVSDSTYRNLDLGFGCSVTSTEFVDNTTLVYAGIVQIGVIDINLDTPLYATAVGHSINEVSIMDGQFVFSTEYGAEIRRQDLWLASFYRPNGLISHYAQTTTGLNSLVIVIDSITNDIYIVNQANYNQNTNLPIYGRFSNHNAIVRRLDWNGANGLVASGDDEGVIWVWDPVTVEPVMQLTGHNGPILDITWNPDGTQIATASDDGTVRVWDWPSGTMEIVDSGRLFTAVAYRPDGAQLAYGGEILNGVASLANLGVEIIPAPAIRLPTSTPTPTNAPTSAFTPTNTPTRTPTPTPTPIPLPPANTNLLTNPSFASGLAPWQTVNFSAGGVVSGVLEVTQPTTVEFGVVWYNRQRRHSALGYLSPAQFEQLVAT